LGSCLRLRSLGAVVPAAAPNPAMIIAIACDLANGSLYLNRGYRRFSTNGCVCSDCLHLVEPLRAVRWVRRSVTLASRPAGTQTLCSHSEVIPRPWARISYKPCRRPAIRKCPLPFAFTACGVLPSAVCQKTSANATGAPLPLSTTPSRAPSILLVCAKVGANSRRKASVAKQSLRTVHLEAAWSNFTVPERRLVGSGAKGLTVRAATSEPPLIDCRNGVAAYYRYRYCGHS